MTDDMDERMKIETLLDDIHDLLDKSWELPFSRGKSVVSADKIRALLDDISSGLPGCIAQAEQIIEQRDSILKTAQQESENLIAAAEERRKVLLSEEQLVVDAEKMSREIISDAESAAKSTRMQLYEFADNMLKRTDDEMSRELESLRKLRETITENINREE